MSSDRFRPLGRTINFRLTAWYSGIFVTSVIGLFLALYFVLSASLRTKDAELIHAKLKEFAAEFKEEGVDEVKKLGQDKRSSTFFVRLADPENRTMFINMPDEAMSAALRLLEGPRRKTHKRMEIPLGRKETLELRTAHLRGGVILQIGRSTSHRQAFLDYFQRVCAAILFPMLALGISGGAFLAHRALRPLHQLNDIVRTIIETGKIDARIPPQNTAGELNDLVLSFNQMLEKIDGLIQGMKGILDNVAHDLRTPITRLRGAAELALRNPLDTRSSQEALADCVEESERVVTLLNALMDISQVETGAMKLELKRVDVARIVAQILDLYREVAEENKITIFASVPEDIWIRADENRIRQAVGNLIDNAIKYTPPAGEIHIESRIENGELAFSVRDTGIGIATEELPCVWDRLYRGDKSRSQQGLGLGLSLVKAIVQAHAGHVAIESKPGSGSLFTLYLPAASAAPV